jgi:hypothetical protein
MDSNLSRNERETQLRSGCHLFIENLSMLRYCFEKLSALSLAPQMPELNHAGRVMRRCPDEQGDCSAHLYTLRIEFGRKNAGIRLPLWGEFASLVLIPVQAIDLDPVEHVQIALPHTGKR